MFTVLESEFDDEYIFGYQNGFNIAVAFTGFTTNSEWELDPSYGEIVFNQYSWDILEDGSFVETRLKLESHVCTPE